MRTSARRNSALPIASTSRSGRPRISSARTYTGRSRAALPDLTPSISARQAQFDAAVARRNVARLRENRAPDACSHHGQQRDQARRTHAARRARGAPAAGPAGWTQQTQQGPISRHGAGSGRKVCVAAARTRLFSPGAGRFVESIIHEHPRRRPCRRRMGRPGAPPRVRGLARLVARAAARTRHVAPGQRRCELSPLPARRQRRRREPHRHGRAAAAGGRASVRADRAR